MTEIKKDDRFTWRPIWTSPDHEVYVEVRRVAIDGSWADIWCRPVRESEVDAWTKRQALPLSVEFTPGWPPAVTA